MASCNIDTIRGFLQCKGFHEGWFQPLHLHYIISAKQEGAT